MYNTLITIRNKYTDINSGMNNKGILITKLLIFKVLFIFIYISEFDYFLLFFDAFAISDDFLLEAVFSFLITDSSFIFFSFLTILAL